MAPGLARRLPLAAPHCQSLHNSLSFISAQSPKLFRTALTARNPRREKCQSVDMIGGLQSSVTQANGEVSADLMALSVISNCGDFQMAPRLLTTQGSRFRIHGETQPLAFCFKRKQNIVDEDLAPIKLYASRALLRSKDGTA